MSDRVVNAIPRPRGRTKSFIPNEEVQIFRTAFCRKMAAGTCATCQERGFVRYSWATGARATCTASWSFGSYCGREDEGGGIIAGETYKSNILILYKNCISLGVVPSLE